MKEKLIRIEKLMHQISPLPWEFSANIPFDVQVKRPRESQSKYSSTNPHSWDYSDGIYLANCVNEMPNILKYVWELEDKIEKLKEEIDFINQRYKK